MDVVVVVVIAEADVTAAAVEFDVLDDVKVLDGVVVDDDVALDETLLGVQMSSQIVDSVDKVEHEGEELKLDEILLEEEEDKQQLLVKILFFWPLLNDFFWWHKVEYSFDVVHLSLEPLITAPTTGWILFCDILWVKEEDVKVEEEEDWLQGLRSMKPFCIRNWIPRCV